MRHCRVRLSNDFIMIQSNMNFFVILCVLLAQALPAASSSGLAYYPDSASLCVAENGFCWSMVKSESECKKFNAIRSALMVFANTGWQDGWPVYTMLWDCYQWQKDCFQDERDPVAKITKSELSSVISFERHAALHPTLSDEEKRLMYLAFITPKVGALVEVVNALSLLGDAWSEDAQKSMQHLFMVTSTFCEAAHSSSGVSIKEGFPNLFGSAEGLRVSCAKIVRSLCQLKHLRQKYCLIKDIFPELAEVLGQAVRVHSTRLAGERARMNFISTRFPIADGSNCAYQDFNRLIEESNTVLHCLSGLCEGQLVEELSITKDFQNPLLKVRDLENLGNCVHDWEVQAIRESVKYVMDKGMTGQRSESDIFDEIRLLPFGESFAHFLPPQRM